MKNFNLTPTIIMASAFCFILFTADANAQSCNKTEKTTTCVKQNEQSLGAVNAEIYALEKELASLELVAKQNNIDLGASWNYMILNKTATAAATEEKVTAKK